MITTVDVFLLLEGTGLQVGAAIEFLLAQKLLLVLTHAVVVGVALGLVHDEGLAEVLQLLRDGAAGAPAGVALLLRGCRGGRGCGRPYYGPSDGPPAVEQVVVGWQRILC